MASVAKRKTVIYYEAEIGTIIPFLYMMGVQPLTACGGSASTATMCIALKDLPTPLPVLPGVSRIRSAPTLPSKPLRKRDSNSRGESVSKADAPLHR